MSASAGAVGGIVRTVEDFLLQAAELAALAAETIAVVIIILALLEAVAAVIVVLLRHRLSFDERWDDVRLRLGRWLLLALDFLVAADVLRTAVAPDWTQLGQLAVVVLIRVVLEYFLERETEKEEHKEKKRG